MDDVVAPDSFAEANSKTGNKKSAEKNYENFGHITSGSWFEWDLSIIC